MLLLVGAGISLLASGGLARAEVWEFDRQGHILAAPHARMARNASYDKNVSGRAVVPADSMSTRSVDSAIYRPMAEGVARSFAADAGVAAAGLAPEDFTRLFVALIDQESRFNPRARSPKGARGLGQLMPETAEELGVRDAFDPMENLRGAARYLVAQLADFGRADLARAAYNAGPHRVARYQGIPPFRETRDYVARITRAADLAPPAPESEPEVVEAASALTTPQPPKGTVLEWQN